MQGDSTLKTLTVAGLLCIVCSVLVSGAVVMLRPIQEKNRVIDFRRNLLMAAGLIKSDANVDMITEQYKKVEIKLVDLATGEYVASDNAEAYDTKQAAKDPKRNYKIPAKLDISRIRQREKVSKIFLIKNGSEVEKIILPIRGKGLWSTMYGFLALKTDTRTVDGFGFYDQGETPGLGGEVDNPRWKAKWVGKKISDDNFVPNLRVVKGGVKDGPDASHQIDALSGATLTSNGVEHLVNYWMGDNGYGLYLKKVRAGGML